MKLVIKINSSFVTYPEPDLSTSSDISSRITTPCLTDDQTNNTSLMDIVNIYCPTSSFTSEEY